MKKFIVVIAASMIFVSGLAGSNESVSEKLNLEQIDEQATEARGDLLLQSDSQAIEYAAACCKVCKKGKACGNSCISRSYTCHKAPGCACNAPP